LSWYKSLKKLGSNEPITDYPKIGMLLRHVQDTKALYPELVNVLKVQDQKAAFVYVNDLMLRNNVELTHAKVKRTKENTTIKQIKDLYNICASDAEIYLRLDPELENLHDIF